MSWTPDNCSIRETHAHTTPPKRRPLLNFSVLNDSSEFSTKREHSHSEPKRVRMPPTPKGKKLISVGNKRRSLTLANSYVDYETLAIRLSEKFNFLTILGTGSFSTVYKIQCKKTAKLYALKHLTRYADGVDRWRNDRELRNYATLPSHMNIVRYFDSWSDMKAIQMELCDQSLEEMAEKNHDLPESLVWIVLIDMLKALMHLEIHNFIHLDVKPSNILVGYDGRYKLCDFSTLVRSNRRGEAIRDDRPEDGDGRYLAPEVLNDVFTIKEDVFSLGLAILELASDLQMPRGDQPYLDLRSGHLPDDLVSGIGDSLLLIISKLLTPDYSRRPPASKVIKMLCVEEQMAHIENNRIIPPHESHSQTPPLSPVSSLSHMTGSGDELDEQSRLLRRHIVMMIDDEDREHQDTESTPQTSPHATGSRYGGGDTDDEDDRFIGPLPIPLKFD